jgi:hypothetical protein
MVCSQGPRIGQRLHRDAFLVEVEQAQEIDEVALDEAQRAQIGQLRVLETQAAQRADLGADLVHIGCELHAGVAALEAVLDLCSGKLVQHHLHHREFVQVSVGR